MFGRLLLRCFTETAVASYQACLYMFYHDIGMYNCREFIVMPECELIGELAGSEFCGSLM